MRELKLIIVQDEQDIEAAEIFVDGTVAENKVRFLLDTGAARTCLVNNQYLATLEATDQRHSSGVFAKSSDDLVTIPHIQIGPIAKDNFSVVRLSDQNPHLKNLIGMDLLQSYQCHFMFNENRVVIDADESDTYHATDHAGFQSLFVDKVFHPYVDVYFGGKVGKSVWDTGASITIVNTAFIEQHPAFFQLAGESSGTDSTGAQMDTPMYIMAETVIGGYPFAPHKVASVDLSHVNSTIETPMDLILGYSTLSQANWLFDFPRKRWMITKRILG